MPAFKGQQSDIHLSPVLFTLVFQVVQHLCHVMVAVVDNDVMVGLLEHLVGFGDGLVPLFIGVLVVIEDQVL